jgi:hypothetical protein
MPPPAGRSGKEKSDAFRARIAAAPGGARLARMKVEISQPEGTPHEVELPGPEAVIGRDPSCDLVLNDSRCSRRHAVLEDGPDGLVIQDAGSSNGLTVNGRRLERSRLRPGDTVRIGDTTLTILSQAPGTLMGPALAESPTPQGSVDATPRAAVPPPRPSRRPPRRAVTRRDTGPPVTLTALSVLWALSAPSWLVAGLLLAIRADALLTGSVAVGAGLVLGAFGAVMAAGLRARAYWARHLQIATAGIGVFICPFTFASVTILIYMLRPDVRAAFESGAPGGGAGEAEPTFALSILGMLALGLVLTGVALVGLSRP